MTKNQGWMIVGLLVIVVALWMIHNENESQATVNRTVGCDTPCYTAYTNSSQTTDDTNQLHTCLNACAAENGLPPSY